MLVKVYGTDSHEEETRCSPADCVGCRAIPVVGKPDARHVSIGYVERRNWSMRTAMRRYARLPNGFSRKVEDHAAAVALYRFSYSFMEIHHRLRVTPAVAAGVADWLWDAGDLVSLLEAEGRSQRAG